MTSNKITSPTNAHIKNVVKLRDRKERTSSGLTIVEGIREIPRAIEEDVKVCKIFICPELISETDQIDFLKDPAGQGVSLFETTKEVFSKISYGDRKEGVLAVVEPSLLSLDDLEVPDDPLYVVAEHIEKPGNLGAILRTCDGAGVHALIVADALTDLYNPNVIRASLGTIFSLPIVSCTNEEAVAFLEKNNIKVCTAMPDANVIYSQMDLNCPLSIVIGSEKEGLSTFWKNSADIHVRIPMKGKADSLNVSATAAILIYEAVRQKSHISP